jgi:phage tail sheath protein FI
MPVRPTYPGVYIEEIPSGVRTITEVATSVAAFVGSFRKGLLDEAVQVFGMADFEREYGGLDRNSETSYAVQQFFLNGGTEAWIVRVADTAGLPAALPPVPGAAAAEVVLTADPGGAGDEIVRLRAGRRIRGESAVNPGEWGNALRVEVDYDTADPAEQFNLRLSEVRIAGDRTEVVQTETFRNLTMRPDVPNNAIEVVNDGSRLVQLSRAGLATVFPDPFVASFRPAPTGTLGAGIAAATPAIVPNHGDAFDVDIGLPTGPIGGSIDYGGPAVPEPTSYPALLPFLQAAIRRAAASTDVPDGLKPLLTGATVSLVTELSGATPFRFAVRLGRAARPFEPDAQITLSGGAATALGLVAGAVVNDQQIVLDGGSDGPPAAPGTSFRPIPPASFIGSSVPRTGVNALDDVDLFNILCIPEATTLPTPAGMRSVYTAATDYVRDRRAMLIVDIPEADAASLDAVQTWLAENEGLRDPNLAIYFPRTNIPDPLNRNRPRSIGSSGTIAGLWARTDAQRGVWKAPAGTDARLRNVESLGYNLTDQENGVLNPLGVNALRTFPVYSNICWGARTLEGADVLASDWKYVPVRRTTLFIEESLFRGTKWVVFEPNDEPLWSQIRLNVGAFMQDLFRKGAFQGATPREAYFVKCDGETTIQTDIDRGIVNIEVGFAPLKPAEFVILKIQQIVRRPEA